MALGTREAYEQHVDALTAMDLEGVVAGYAEQAVLVSNGVIGHGREHIRAVFADVLSAAAELEPEVRVLVDGDVVFVSWTAGARSGTPLTGADTFVIQDGLITAHTGFVAAGTPAAGLSPE